jgi:CheY-like chemotaxis protein
MQLKDATVLVVDDEPLLLEIMTTWFEREQCRVLAAENGALALAKIASERIHVIVSDVRMPVMDGFSLVSRIKESGSYKPSVIFVSGFHDISPRMSYDLGVEATFPKPVERKELVSTVGRILVDRSELWSSPPRDEPAPSLRMILGSVSEAVEQGLIAFGRGGFCIQSDLSLPEGPVRLAVEFAAERKSISGEGQVRWCEAGERRMGVEITSLRATCRDWVSDLTAANPTLSFIPSSTRARGQSATLPFSRTLTPRREGSIGAP